MDGDPVRLKRRNQLAGGRIDPHHVNGKRQDDRQQHEEAEVVRAEPDGAQHEYEHGRASDGRDELVHVAPGDPVLGQAPGADGSHVQDQAAHVSKKAARTHGPQATATAGSLRGLWQAADRRRAPAVTGCTAAYRRSPPPSPAPAEPSASRADVTPPTPFARLTPPDPRMAAPARLARAEVGEPAVT